MPPPTNKSSPPSPIKPLTAASLKCIAWNAGPSLMIAKCAVRSNPATYGEVLSISQSIYAFVRWVIAVSQVSRRPRPLPPLEIAITRRLALRWLQQRLNTRHEDCSDKPLWSHHKSIIENIKLQYSNSLKIRGADVQNSPFTKLNILPSHHIKLRVGCNNSLARKV